MAYGSTFMVRVTGLGGDAVCDGLRREYRVRLHQTSRGDKAVEDFAGEFGKEGGCRT